MATKKYSIEPTVRLNSQQPSKWYAYGRLKGKKWQRVTPFESTDENKFKAQVWAVREWEGEGGLQPLRPGVDATLGARKGGTLAAGAELDAQAIRIKIGPDVPDPRRGKKSNLLANRKYGLARLKKTLNPETGLAFFTNNYLLSEEAPSHAYLIGYMAARVGDYEKLGKELANSTVSDERAALNGARRRLGLKEVDWPEMAERDTDQNPLSADEQGALLEVVDNKLHRECIMVYLATGVRESELYMIEILSPKEIMVWGTKSDKGKRKRNTAERVLPVSKETMSILVGWGLRPTRKGERGKARVEVPLWHNSARDLEKLCVLAGIAKRSAKDFRGTYATTHATSNLISPFALRDRMGHSSMEPLEKHYVNLEMRDPKGLAATLAGGPNPYAALAARRRTALSVVK